MRYLIGNDNVPLGCIPICDNSVQLAATGSHNTATNTDACDCKIVEDVRESRQHRPTTVSPPQSRSPTRSRSSSPTPNVGNRRTPRNVNAAYQTLTDEYCLQQFQIFETALNVRAGTVLEAATRIPSGLKLERFVRVCKEVVNCAQLRDRTFITTDFNRLVKKGLLAGYFEDLKPFFGAIKHAYAFDVVTTEEQLQFMQSYYCDSFRTE